MKMWKKGFSVVLALLFVFVSTQVVFATEDISEQTEEFCYVVIGSDETMSGAEEDSFVEAQAAASVNFTVTAPRVGASRFSTVVTSSTALYPVAGWEWGEAAPGSSRFETMTDSTFKSGYAYAIMISFLPEGPTLYPTVTVNGNSATLSGSMVIYNFGYLGGSADPVYPDDPGDYEPDDGSNGFLDFLMLLVDIPLEIIYFLFNIITFPFRWLFGLL